MLDRVEQLTVGNLDALSTRLTITAADLLERRFIRGKALSAAFACMFAKHEARSLLTGEIVPNESYMQEFTTKNFQGLFETRALTGALSREYQSSKMFANTFLFSEDDLLAAKRYSGTDVIKNCIERHGPDADRILRSQFVIPAAVDFLSQGDLGSFLATRASVVPEPPTPPKSCMSRTGRSAARWRCWRIGSASNCFAGRRRNSA